MIKKVAGSLYTHKSNIKELKSKLSKKQLDLFNNLWHKINEDNEDFLAKDYVVKYNTKNDAVTFSVVLGWDNLLPHSELYEPIILMYIRYKPVLQNTKICDWERFCKTPVKLQVYHNKWQFVSETYTGFDIQKSKERTQHWNSIPNIKSLKSKIGYQEFWQELLKANRMPIYVES